MENDSAVSAGSPRLPLTTTSAKLTDGNGSNRADTIPAPWVRAYETRADECGRARHRALYDAFAGPKRAGGGEPA